MLVLFVRFNLIVEKRHIQLVEKQGKKEKDFIQTCYMFINKLSFVLQENFTSTPILMLSGPTLSVGRIWKPAQKQKCMNLSSSLL